MSVMLAVALGVTPVAWIVGALVWLASSGEPAADELGSAFGVC